MECSQNALMKVCQAQMLPAILLNCHLSSWRILLLKKNGLIPGPLITRPEKRSLMKLSERSKKLQHLMKDMPATGNLGFGFLDMAWHTITNPVDTNIADFETAAMEKTELFPAVEGTNMSASFGHIFGGGYAAGYYGYKWAEVLDADAFSYFTETGIFNKETAASFRKNILEKGGTEKPLDLYVRFRGKEPSIDALLEEKRTEIKISG